jgi:hypothetical protein
MKTKRILIKKGERVAISIKQTDSEAVCDGKRTGAAISGSLIGPGTVAIVTTPKPAMAFEKRLRALMRARRTFHRIMEWVAEKAS